MRIPLCDAYLTPDDQSAVMQVLQAGWLSSVAPVVEDFESAFLAQLHTWGASSALGTLATQSGTSALWMLLYVLNLPVGTEVLCPVTSFVASIHPFLYQSFKLRFVDVDPHSWAPSLQAFQAAQTPQTKVVLVAHLYGLAMPELLALRRWCDEEGLILIEDAAEALGTLVEGKPVGTVGHYGVYSFNVNKTLTTASGGILVSEDHAVLAQIKHQSTQSKCYGEGELFHDAVGFNLRMNALHAALGLSQLKRLPEILDAKKAIASRYAKGLEGLNGLDVVYQGIPPYSKALAQVAPSYWLNLVYVDSHATRRALQTHLARHGVQVRPVFMSFPEMPYLHPFWANPSSHPREAFPHAYRLWERGLNLPSSPHLSEVDQAEVMALLQSFLSDKS